jgi:hypothetical protein
MGNNLKAIKKYFKGLYNKFWFKFIIKENEFHKTLDINMDFILGKTREEKYKYFKDLIRKRNLAHEMSKDLN